MKILSLPYLIIGCIVTLCCNYAQAQTLQISSNPTTCNGAEGSITFSALTPNTSYQVTYIEGGVTKGPITVMSNAFGQISLPNLSKGLYTGFTFTSGGSSLAFVGGVVLSDPIFIPTFNAVPPICAGDPAPALPNTSTNGFTGSWSPGSVDNQATGTYTFNPTPGTCALPVTLTVVVNPKKVPVFPFGNGLVICNSGTVPILTNTSTNGITGTWSPAVVDPAHSGVYIFTPTTTGCVTGTTFSVIVNPIITPSFTFGNSASICLGDGVPSLPNTSTNGITGSWSPAMVDPNNSGTYSFTPDPGQCAIPVSYVLTVKPIIPPVFNNFPNAAATICNGDVAPVLPAATDNGMTGTWTPAVVSNTTSGTYVFKSTSDPCAPPLTLTVTVKPILTPAFSFGPSQSVCINANPPVLPAISSNGINGTWSPAIVNNQNIGTFTYKFTPAAGQCANPVSFNYQVNPIPSVVNVRKDTTVYDGAVLPYYDFPINIPVTGVNWINNNPGIGLAATGSGAVPSFTATNMTDNPVTGVVTATPYVNGCMGATQSYKITVLPLDKDLFVPNVFSPNADGKNDYLYVYGNYIASFEMHIFNQWGQQMITITDKKQGWDGKFKGSAQPVGVYVYVLKGVTTDGRQVNKKGSITLVR